MPDPTGLNGNLAANPFLCGVDPTAPDLGLGLHGNAPCLQGNNGCGILMGAFGEACEATGVPGEPAGAVEATSIGAVKARY